jgi:hypothetical protein
MPVYTGFAVWKSLQLDPEPLVDRLSSGKVRYSLELGDDKN